MKANRKLLLFAVVLMAVVAVLGSCSKKTCPAYSKVDTHQYQNNG
jgi:hypothetical protein